MNALTTTNQSGMLMELSQDMQQRAAALAAHSRVTANMGNDIQGAPRNVIKLKPNMMLLSQNGTVVSQPMSSIDVVILGTSLHLERAWYRTAYNENQDTTQPDCFSRDGVTPDASCKQEVMPRVWDIDPATNQVRVDAAGNGVSRCVRACSECPMNQKDQVSGRKACQFLKRLACVLPNDIGGTVYSLKIGAMSVFGDSDQVFGKTFQEYSAFLQTKNAQWPGGIPASIVITRISMKPADVAVTRFNAVGWLDEGSWNLSMSREQDPAVLAITEGRMAQSAPALPAPSAAPALPAPQQPVQTAPQPVLQMAPQPVQQMAPQPVQQMAPHPVQTYTPAPVAPAPSVAPSVPAPAPPTVAASPTQQLLASAMQNPAVPETVRQWAVSPGVTPDQVLAWLQQNMPNVVPMPTAPQLAPLQAPAAPVMVAPQHASMAAPAPMAPAPTAPMPVAAPSPYAQVPQQQAQAPGMVMHQGQTSPELAGQLAALTAAFDS